MTISGFHHLTLHVPCPPLFAQKNSMLSDEDHALLHDVCCMWMWLLPKLKMEFPGTTIQKHEDLFAKGFLGNNKIFCGIQFYLGYVLPGKNLD